MKNRSRSNLAKWWLIVTMLGTASCDRRDHADSSETGPADARPHLDVPPAPPSGHDGGERKADEPAVHREFSSKLRQAHRAVDEAKGEEDLLAARRMLEEVYETAPKTRQTVELREDVAARIARLSLRTGDVTRARDTASRALELRDEPSITRANLLIVLADAEEMLERQDEARRHLMEALEMNQALLDKELENP